MRRGHLIVNPAAGAARADRWTDELIARARAAGLVLEAHRTSAPGDASAIAARCAAHSPDLVVVAGGDGTVGEAAAGLVGTTIPLAIIPLGTANVLAREYGIGSRVRHAEAVMTSRRTRPLTAWDAAGRTCLLWMGVGLDARVMRRAAPALKRRFGRAGIAVTAIPELLRYDFPGLTVEGIDAIGRPFTMDATFVVAANIKRYGGEPILSPEADPEDDLLALTCVTSRSRLTLIQLFGDAILRRVDPAPSPEIRRIAAREVRVRTARGAPVEAHVDGDPVGTTPVSIGPVMGRLLIVVPEERA